MPTAPQDILATVVDPKAHADPPRLNAAYRLAAPATIPWRGPNCLASIRSGSSPNTPTSSRSAATTRLFPYGDYPSTLAPHEQVERGRAARAAGRPLLYTLVQMDEPDHMKYRALTQAWFMPQNIRKLEDRIRELAREAVARMEAHGRRMRLRRTRSPCTFRCG